jgi:HSP20 family molecular chaperone IbpA
LKDDTDRQVRSQNRKSNCPDACDFPSSKREANPRFHKIEHLKVDFHKSRLPEDPEPLVDVIEEADAIVVVAGLLGVRKEDLQIHAAHCSLTISSDTSEHKYYRELALPAATEPESAVATYKNGVLHIRLKKLAVDAQPLTE